jgi:hypothetical protein
MTGEPWPEWLGPLTLARDLTPFFGWLGVAIGVIVVAGSALLVYRRKVLSDDSARDAQSGLMQQLRAMRDRGDLTHEEYDAAKRAMVARVSGAAPPATPRPPPPGDRIAPAGFDLTGTPLPRPPKGPARG